MHIYADYSPNVVIWITEARINTCLSLLKAYKYKTCFYCLIWILPTHFPRAYLLLWVLSLPNYYGRDHINSATFRPYICMRLFVTPSGGEFEWAINRSLQRDFSLTASKPRLLMKQTTSLTANEKVRTIEYFTFNEPNDQIRRKGLTKGMCLP